MENLYLYIFLRHRPYHVDITSRCGVNTHKSIVTLPTFKNNTVLCVCTFSLYVYRTSSHQTGWNYCKVTPQGNGSTEVSFCEGPNPIGYCFRRDMATKGYLQYLINKMTWHYFYRRRRKKPHPEPNNSAGKTYISKCSRTPLIRKKVIRNANNPGRFGTSGKYFLTIIVIRLFYGFNSPHHPTVKYI